MSGSTSPVVTTVTADIADLRRAGAEVASIFGKMFTDAERVGGAMRQQATAAEAAAGGMRNLGSMVGQAGFQIQDFAVQVQSGTSALTALSQQGSQLLGVFGTGGAIAGAALTVGLLAVSLMQGADATKAYEQANKAFAEGQQRVVELLETTRQRAVRLHEEFRRMAGASLLTQMTEASAGAETFGQQILTLERQQAALQRDLAQASPRSRAGVAADLAEVERNLAWARDRADFFSGRQRSIGRQMEEVANAPGGAEKGKPTIERASGGSRGADREVSEVWRTLSAALRDVDNATYEAANNFQRLIEQLSPAEGAVAKYEERVSILADALNKGAISQDQFNRGLGLAVQELDRSMARAANTGDDLKSLGREIGTVFTSAFDGLISGSRTASDALQRLEQGFVRIIERTFITKPLETALNSALDGKTLGGVASSIGSWVGSLFGRASGGPVFAGDSYIVGEQGPEIFTPGASGSITPNHAMGGGGVYIDARGAEPGVEAKIRHVVMGMLPTISAATRGELFADVNRGGTAARTLGRRR